MQHQQPCKSDHRAISRFGRDSPIYLLISKNLFVYSFPKINCKFSIASRVRIFSWSCGSLRGLCASPPLRSCSGVRAAQARSDPAERSRGGTATETGRAVGFNCTGQQAWGHGGGAAAVRLARRDPQGKRAHWRSCGRLGERGADTGRGRRGGIRPSSASGAHPNSRPTGLRRTAARARASESRLGVVACESHGPAQ